MRRIGCPLSCYSSFNHFDSAHDAYARELEALLMREKQVISGVVSPSTDNYLRRNAFLLMSSE